jgi:hypothetical protein
MGVDAYRLGSRLEWMSSDRQARVQGKTGILSMDSQRLIHRELTLARVDSSGPVKTASTLTVEMERLVSRMPLSGSGPRLAAIGAASLDAGRP